jgi:hypothetical protein
MEEKVHNSTKTNLMNFDRFSFTTRLDKIAFFLSFSLSLGDSAINNLDVSQPSRGAYVFMGLSYKVSEL